jgi:hypothetical protein
MSASKKLLTFQPIDVSKQLKGEVEKKKFWNRSLVIMAENGSKFSIPYPALAIILPLVVSLIINIGFTIRWGTILERDLTNAQEKIKSLEGQLDIEKTWRDNTRERLLKLELRQEERKK